MPSNFEIAYYWVFFLLPLPFIVYWILPPLRMRSASLRLPTFQNAAKYTGQKARKSAFIKKRGLFNWFLLYSVWALSIFALSSPRLIGEAELIVKTSRSFLIAADISFSMATKDWKLENKKVRRWDAVKSLMQEFIAKREGDRMGLIFFGSSAYIQAPFTSDLSTISQLLEEADVGMAGQMTHIGKAITKSVELFEKDSIETKVLLLLTDGVDAGTDILPLDAADLARKDSVIIYTIGIGDPKSGGSDLDEKTLKEIANLTNGTYFLAENESRLEEIYAEVDKLEPIEYKESENKPITHLYFYPLGLAIGILLLLLLLGSLNNILKKLKGKEDFNA